MSKLKKDCTPEEWAKETARSRAKHRKRRLDPLERARDRERTRQWAKTPEGQRRVKENNRRHSWKRQGFSVALVYALFQTQEGRCGVCDKNITEQTAAADHCHQTNKPRGLLCSHCNLAEGFIGKTGLDPKEFGKRLAAYLANPPARIAEIL